MYWIVTPNPVRILTCLFVIVSFCSLHAQNEKKSVVIGSMTSKPTALLILNPTDGDQGFLLPQLNSSQRQSLHPNSPDEDGLIVFDITEKIFYYWKDGAWVKGLGDHPSPVLSFNE